MHGGCYRRDNFLRRWINYGKPTRSTLLCVEIEVRRNARLAVQRYGRDMERVFSLRHEIRLGKINCVLIKEERYLGSYRLYINYAHFCLDEESNMPAVFRLHTYTYIPFTSEYRNSINYTYACTFVLTKCISLNNIIH